MSAVLLARQITERQITERLLRDAGIGRGMHVLDLSCGTGDLSLLAAKLVGPNGLVLGLDRDAAVIEAARDRAWRAGLDHVYFLEAGIQDLRDEGPFDAIVGDDAPERDVARLLVPGGLLVRK